MLKLQQLLLSALFVSAPLLARGQIACVLPDNPTPAPHKSATPQTAIWIKISLSRQTLSLYRRHKLVKVYGISTGARGAGERLHSLKTPRGLHRIDAKIGDGAPLFTVFKGRKSAGHCWSANSSQTGDLILTRILTLEGLESGKNRGNDAHNHCVDTKQRHIYIHGTHQEGMIGSPVSHGCVRMKNLDVAELFELVPLGSHVEIG